MRHFDPMASVGRLTGGPDHVIGAGTRTYGVAVLKDFWLYLKVRKKWWLAPIVALLMLFGLLVAATQGSAVAPFIYTLF